MRKVLSALLAIVLVAAVFVPAASARGGRGFHSGGRFHGGHAHGGGRFHGGHGCFGCGFGFGFFSGAVLGGALAAPYYYRPYPYPYYVAPPVYTAPQPYCSTQQGYWQQVPMSSDAGFTTFQNVWVPQQTVCR